jgi:hypothetical protein
MRHYYRVTNGGKAAGGFVMREPLSEDDFLAASSGRKPDQTANVSGLIKSGAQFGFVELVATQEADHHFPAGSVSIWTIDDETGVVQGWLVEPSPAP